MTVERFVHAAHLIENAPVSPTVEDAFAILKNLEREGESGTSTLWSYVIDVKEEADSIGTPKGHRSAKLLICVLSISPALRRPC